MKKIIFLLFFFANQICSAQDKITFDYDTAGNQIKRELCINCLTNKPSKNEKQLTPDDYEVSEQVSYYPNPVKEELYLKWELENNKRVNSIQLYSFTGQLLQSYNSSASTKQTIPFENLQSGIYIIFLQYSNGDEKTIKIIKK